MDMENRKGIEKITDTLRNFMAIPKSLINEEVPSVYGSMLLQEQAEIIRYYNVYDNGASFVMPLDGDFIPSDITFRKVRSLIDREASFMFSNPPDMMVKLAKRNSDPTETDKTNISILQETVDKVLEYNDVKGQLVKAAKDCFIGKRVGLIMNFNDEEGISINFIPSLEFVYETSSLNSNVITKFVQFYKFSDGQTNGYNRIYKKKYYMQDGFCYVDEGVYDTSGQLVEQIISESKTKFTYIPAWVILNDGLLGDDNGQSDVALLEEYESYLSKMNNMDLDAERKNMNPIKYLMDVDPNTSKNLSVRAGSLWDLQRDPTLENASPMVGTIESSLSYSAAFNTTFDRIKNMMHDQISVPNVNVESMVGVLTSGKAIQAVYWPLIVRCNEKMLSWGKALNGMLKTIIEGGKLYPNSLKVMGIDATLPVIEYTTQVENNYPIPDDVNEEQQLDLSKVMNQTMSRKSFMIKWQGLTNDEADAELEQIAKERQILEESYSTLPNMDYSDVNSDDTQNDSDTLDTEE